MSSSQADSALQTQLIAEQLFKAVRQNDFKTFANYLGYRGVDPYRRYYDKIRLEREEDMLQSETFFKRINISIQQCDYFEFNEYEEKTDKEGRLWHIWKIQFFKDLTPLKARYLEFLMVNNSFLLFNID